MKIKDKKIIAEAELCNIPIFVFIAKDELSAETIVDYQKRCRDAGCDTAHINGVIARLAEFEQWQEENPDIRNATPVKADWKLRKQISTDIAKKLKEKHSIE